MSGDNQNRWDSDEVVQLIDIVKGCECIYNPLDRNYFCRPYVESVWRDIDIRFRKRPGASLSKWTNLRISFRREYQLLIKNKAKPSWSYFETMMFLMPYLRKKRTNGKLENHIQEALEQISSITRSNVKSYIANIEPCEETDETDAAYEVDEIAEESSWNQSIEVKDENDESIDDQVECIEDSEDDEPDGRNDDDNKIVIVETKDNDSNFVFNTSSLKRSCQLSPTTSPEAKKPMIVIESQPIELASRTTTASTATVTSCECKTNPDAMFLMSLLPDMQLLSRKDRGIFKIEVQRIIQNLLYPDG